MCASTILIAPLNWGLGHATRCVPIIRNYLANGQRVVLAADGDALSWLKSEFPDLKTIRLPGFNIQYSPSGSQLFAIIRQLPKIIAGTIREHRHLKKLIREENIQTVISDNRFGLWNKSVKSIYITHQLLIRAPYRWMEPLLRFCHRCIINRYDECWIPDIEGDGNLSGELSHKYPLPRNARLIGWLSRFPSTNAIPVKKNYTNLCLISGPEPHRTLFEQMCIGRFKNSIEPTLIVRGKPGDCMSESAIGNIDLVSVLSSGELKTHLLQTPNIFCRSGYSTLMDLKLLEREANLFPTPGQPEQEYLSKLHKK
ncbi:hypothetical protein [Paludibacter sp.]|uniref:hypothetical protein n=1 Tax=Paludibacter sp. TaxID=1898105 RepID=UPI001353ADE7|nr:hypothetical protein [Paludibacter sp.]MTK52897.1 glycosyltransferase [Paludibacter sp.]